MSFIRCISCLLVALFFVTVEAKQKVCLNMIVKDEAKVIKRALASVKPLIDYWVIVDTGSSDETKQIIKEFMADVPGELYERPWVNFSHNRTEALKLAKDKGDYLLFIDADEEFVYDEGFKMPRLEKDLYHINTNNGGTIYHRALVVNNRVQWKWVGVVHEVIVANRPTSTGVIQGVTNIARHEGARSKDPLKFKKDAELLEKELERDPSSTRNRFYLAQSYHDAGELDNAIEEYQVRISMAGWPEEVFWSMYKIAQIKERLKHPAEEVISAYLRAFYFRPTRLEPLCSLAAYERGRGVYWRSYHLIKNMLNVPMTKDTLFVNKSVYEYGLLMEFSIIAYWVGEFEESLWACRKLLSMKNLPGHIRACVQRNIKFSESKTSQEKKPA